MPRSNETIRSRPIGRRSLLRSTLLGASAVALSGCDWLGRKPWFNAILGSADTLTNATQQILTTKAGLVPEYPRSAVSENFRANGSISPQTPAYLSLLADQFTTYKLEVRGLVAKPLSLSLTELRALPARTQITRHDCVEGWSDIGMWTGVPLAALLDLAQVEPQAKYVLFHCADELGGPGKPYYESISLQDARHPQTILAYDLNEKPLPVKNGAPLRARVERLLGYKMAKYVMAIELVDNFSKFGKGHGGYWEDEGYSWYAEI